MSHLKAAVEGGESAATGESESGFDGHRLSEVEVEAWLASHFGAAGKDVPDFDYTPRPPCHPLPGRQHRRRRLPPTSTDPKVPPLDLSFPLSISIFYGLKSNVKVRVSAVLRRRRFVVVAARIRDLLESLGLAQESLPSNVANLLNIRAHLRKGQVSSLVAVGDASLRKTRVEEKRAKC